jgi:hypothetical protein
LIAQQRNLMCMRIGRESSGFVPVVGSVFAALRVLPQETAWAFQHIQSSEIGVDAI